MKKIFLIISLLLSVNLFADNDTPVKKSSSSTSSVSKTSMATILAHAICKKRVNDMAFEAGCLTVYRVDGKACSDKKGVTCATNYESLCASHGYTRFASGQGTFSKASQCRSTCEQQYGGKFKQFGGICNGQINP